jgi:redox-sensitive bicupin YhaK (pirin superfamily)
LVMSGEILVNGSTRAKRGDFVLFENAGEDLVLEGTQAAHLLLLNGEPIDEPVFAYGPFVMNTEADIRRAILDFNAGTFGQLD